MKLGKIFICINILVLSLLMYIKILVTDNRTIVLDGGHSETEDFSILLQNDKSFNILRSYAVAI